VAVSHAGVLVEDDRGRLVDGGLGGGSGGLFTELCKSFDKDVESRGLASAGRAAEDDALEARGDRVDLEAFVHPGLVGKEAVVGGGDLVDELLERSQVGGLVDLGELDGVVFEAEDILGEALEELGVLGVQTGSDDLDQGLADERVLYAAVVHEGYFVFAGQVADVHCL